MSTTLFLLTIVTRALLNHLVGVDYSVIQTTSLLLSHQINQRLCFDISITNDAILENNEVFQVFLTSNGLNFNPDTTTVTIIDSNGKHLTLEKVTHDR